jgi:hypothetical protein
MKEKRSNVEEQSILGFFLILSIFNFGAFYEKLISFILESCCLCAGV